MSETSSEETYHQDLSSTESTDSTTEPTEPSTNTTTSDESVTTEPTTDNPDTTGYTEQDSTDALANELSDSEIPTEDTGASEDGTVDVDFYYPTHQDPRRQFPKTSVYLDDVQRLEAEKVRAKIENREPDFDNPPAVQGTPLYTKEQVSHAGNPVQILTDPSVTLPVVK